MPNKLAIIGLALALIATWAALIGIDRMHDRQLDWTVREMNADAVKRLNQIETLRDSLDKLNR